MVSQAGYSGTPLAKKLGIKPGFDIMVINEPPYYFDLFTDLPVGIVINDKSSRKKDFIHLFTKRADEYMSALPVLKEQIKPNGII